VNLDGKVTAADVQSLLTALTNVPAYEAANNNAVSASDFLQIADINGDGVVDNRDVQSLISLVATQPSGGGAVSAVPEPASFLLFAFGTLAFGVLLGRSEFQKRHPIKPL
ncbi:MAG TPA: dockerin type I domain-containing protein, partial [Pirellulales bacterium]